ncbi:MAG: copper-binding protein, partial [Gammaproteobacteria bacterium]|nr:copper-binding protein [Gammaproteobacteria bacterium]
GIGVIVAVEPRKSRLILTHKEIKGFMAPMVEMSFMVTPATLLQGLKPGDNVRFTIDAGRRVIVNVDPLGE